MLIFNAYENLRVITILLAYLTICIDEKLKVQKDSLQ